MTPAERIAFLRPAVPRAAGVWAELGAGGGAFTEALAALLGPQGRVIAVERDERGLAALRRLAGRAAGAAITVSAGDFHRLAEIDQLTRGLDGALFANSLHYSADAAAVLADTSAYLHGGGRLVVIEYDRTQANRWVPYPLPVRGLEAAASAAGLSAPRVVARRPSRYQGEMYCAVLGSPAAAADIAGGNSGEDAHRTGWAQARLLRPRRARIGDTSDAGGHDMGLSPGAGPPAVS